MNTTSNLTDDPDFYASLKSMCEELRMSHTLKVKRGSGRVVLKENYHPILVSLWCYGLMGGITYFVSMRLDGKSISIPGLGDVPFSIAFGGMGFLMASLFVLLAIFLNRRQPIMIFDKASGSLEFPRSNIVIGSYEPQLFKLLPITINRKSRNRTELGSYLLCIERDSKTIVPVYLTTSKKRIIKKMEGIIGVSIQITELPGETVIL